jgi:aryl-alcohol dehydrogenase-like predicted oxidoreductase
MLVSPVCLGAMNFGNAQFGCDENTSLDVISAFLDAGHNFIDTANVYSGTQSEVIVGRAIRGRRDAVVIATKAGAALGPGPFESGTGRKHLMRAVEDSLTRLGTDCIDLYQMHRLDPYTDVEETIRTLDDLVRQGKVRYIGVSNWTASAITEAALLADMHGWEPLVSLQPQYNILVRDIEVEIVPQCLRFGIGILPWSPLASGMLTGKYAGGAEPPAGARLAGETPLQRTWRERLLRDRNREIVRIVMEEAGRLGITPTALSIAWLLDRPGVVAPIIGPKSLAQLRENLSALDVKLPAETVQRIDAASEPAPGYPHDFLRYVRQGPQVDPVPKA